MSPLDDGARMKGRCAAIRRQRFTIAHLCFGELCRTEGETASAVFGTIAHTRKIKGWQDRDAFDDAMIRFMETASKGGTFMVGNLAMIVRSK